MSETSVLVVEDEALIADDLERTLNRLGYRVPAVIAEGELAIAAVSEHSPSVVLMDIKLRGNVDGIDAARLIRERFEKPVVFLTSHSDAATLSRASTARPHGYVMKPFVERDLRVAIELALHKHEVERTLRVRERWFATTLRSIGDAVLATDDKLRVTFMNHAAEALTGWSANEATDKRIDEIFHLEDADGVRVAGPAALALKSRDVAHLPTAARLRQRNGGIRLVDDSAAPIIDHVDVVLGTVVVFRDVTDRKDLEQRLTRSERLASLGTMAAGICHEISNPLTAVIANIENSLESMNDDGAAAGVGENLRDARDAAARIGEILRDMSTFARPPEHRRVNVRLGDVLDNAIKLTSYLVHNHARIERDEKPTPTVDGDPTRLTQVIVNLVLNAAQSFAPGDAKHHTIRLGLGTDADGWAFMEVHDNGAGISPDVLPRIFDPFFTTKAPGAGLGLGLSICNRIVEDLGGQIAVESDLGHGTLFRLRFPPAVEPNDRLARPRHAATRRAGRRGRILIVDDELMVARALAKLFLNQHEVVIRTDGGEALELLLADGAFDAILCDVLMPNVTGVQVYERALAARPSLGPRFLFVTGGAINDATREFLSRPGIVVIPKPVLDIGELRARVDKLVDALGYA